MPPDDANRVLVTPIPAQVRVTVRGPRTTLDDLHADDIGNVQVDVRGGNETRVLFDPSAIHVPPGVAVEQIDPPGIDLRGRTSSRATCRSRSASSGRPRRASW